MFGIGILIPLILIRWKGKDPHGTHKGYSTLTRLSSITIFLWVIFIILYVLSHELINVFWTFPFLSTDLFVIIGIIILAIGFFIDILGLKALGINFRIELPKEKTELVTSGIYKIMRNPIAFGVFLLLIGTFLLIPNFLMLIIVIVNIIAFDAKVRDEEKFLLKRFGKSYEEYKNKVGRYLPFTI